LPYLLAVAEHTIALLFAVARRIVESDKFTRQGKYKAWGPLLFLGQDTIGKTLGIIGLGRVGRAVARRAIALGMKVIYFNRSRNQDVEKELSARYVEKETLLKEADFISIHLPLKPETRHYIGEKELSLMKRNAILVNTSRGPIVEEKGLVEALKHKRIFGAALDVFECEPEISCDFDSVTQLKDLDNVILTPHVASASVETRDKMVVMAAQSIIDFANNKKPEHIVIAQE
jgi:glyoxylate reductase